MAHSAIHFSAGIIIASAVYLPGIFKRCLKGQPSATAVSKWLYLSFGLGIMAIIPSLLSRMGIPETFCRGLHMNLFILHPLIDRMKPGGDAIGPAILTACFTAQYIILLAIIKHTKRKKVKT